MKNNPANRTALLKILEDGHRRGKILEFASPSEMPGASFTFMLRCKPQYSDEWKQFFDEYDTLHQSLKLPTENPE